VIETLLNAWKIPELRKKLVFTLLMFAVFRLGAHVPVPGINPDALRGMFDAQWLSLVDIMSGGALKQFTVFAMGIIPYINASIIIQLLTMVVPYFEKLAKEGNEGRKKMTQYTRYGAVGLGFMQAIVMSVYLNNNPGVMMHPGIGPVIVSAITLTAGTAFLMWLGELITEHGIGNGISLIIFAGIASRLPSGVSTIFSLVKAGEASWISAALILVVMLAMVAAVVAVQEGQRRIPVQYAKRVIGRKVYGGQSTHIPMKINQAGVIPIIFAMAIMSFPSLLAGFFPGSSFAVWITTVMAPRHAAYIIVSSLMIFLFTYFYTAATFNTSDVADNMRKNGGFVPGLRPGRPTAEYLDKVLSRLTFSGATFLTFIALMPTLFTKLSGISLYFGGTSLLIAVGVALDTMKQIESHLLMRHYQGFMK